MKNLKFRAYHPKYGMFYNRGLSITSDGLWGVDFELPTVNGCFGGETGTLMQYTEVDDCNGKPIFEDDIVYLRTGLSNGECIIDMQNRFQIGFEHGCFVLIPKKFANPRQGTNDFPVGRKFIGLDKEAMKFGV